MAVSYSRHMSRIDEQNADVVVVVNAKLTGSLLCWNAELPNPTLEAERDLA